MRPYRRGREILHFVQDDTLGVLGDPYEDKRRGRDPFRMTEEMTRYPPQASLEGDENTR
jgi:hypothetical protein